MKIIREGSAQELLDCICQIRFTLKEWQLVEIKLPVSQSMEDADTVANLVLSLFAGREGKLYVCGPQEILMLLHWGLKEESKKIPEMIVSNLPQGSCEVLINPPGSEGLAKIVLRIEVDLKRLSMSAVRKARRQNIVLVADDDMYMRRLAKMGLETFATVHEVTEGNDVVAAYCKYDPDILFLDIHLPGKMGTEILQEVLEADKTAHVVMLSADSSEESIRFAIKHGARDFVAKPFSPERLMEQVGKCPTFRYEDR